MSSVPKPPSGLPVIASPTVLIGASASPDRYGTVSLSVLTDAVDAAEAAATAAEAAAGDRHDIRSYGAVSGTGDDSAAYQAAYDAAAALGQNTTPIGTWSCTTPVTLSGTKRVRYVKESGAVFSPSSDIYNAIPEAPNATLEKWASNVVQTVYVDGSGGAHLIAGRLRGTGTDAAGQRDYVRVEVQSESSSSGPSWDGVGASNINRDQIAFAAFNFGTAGQLNQAIWGANFYAYAPATSDGATIGMEANVHLDGQTPVKDMAVKAKYGVLSVSKDDAATAAYAVGGLFYKGVILAQSSLPVDSASRAFEYTDLFEVMRDGRTLIGKGASNLFAAGIEFGPSGDFYVTGNAAAAQPFYARSDTLSGAANIRAEQDRALSAAGNQRVFAQKVVSCQTATDGAENGRIEWQTIIAGTLASRMFLQQGLSIGGGAQLTRQYRATATLDFASVAANSVGTSLTVTVTGATTGDHVTVTPPAAAAAQGVIYDGVVTSSNTVTIYPKNVTGGAIDPASGTFSVEVRGWV